MQTLWRLLNCQNCRQYQNYWRHLPNNLTNRFCQIEISFDWSYKPKTLWLRWYNIINQWNILHWLNFRLTWVLCIFSLGLLLLLLFFWVLCLVFRKVSCLTKREVGECWVISYVAVIVIVYFISYFFIFSLQQNALFDKKGLRWFFRGELLQHSSLMAGHQYKIANYFAANSFSLSAAWNWWKYKNTQIKKYK